MRRITEQAISNHPYFPDIKRTVCVDSFQMIASLQQFNMYFFIRYEKQINGVPIDVTQTLAQPVHNLISASNKMEILMRDEHFQPVPNPKWVDNPAPAGADEVAVEMRTVVNEASKYLTMKAYDYLELMLDKQIAVKDVLNAYILVNDTEGFFNK